MVFKMNKGFLHAYNLDVCQSSNGQCTCNSRLSLYMRVGVTHTHTHTHTRLLVDSENLIILFFLSLQSTLH